MAYKTSRSFTFPSAALVAGAAASTASLVIDTTSKVVDGIVTVKIPTVAASSPTGDKIFYVLGYAGDGSGANFTGNGGSAAKDNVDGTSKAVTIDMTATNLVKVGTIRANQGSSGLTITGHFSLFEAWQTLPPEVGIVIVNSQGVDTSTGITVSLRELYY